MQRVPSSFRSTCIPPAPPRNPVESTNDSSTISKLSACDAGYFADRYLKYFVERTSRRAPLINWP
ncbi:hypothetical protein GBAR_LOCUS19488 [Geodia barretti]|uniref:Uncharacterized protein n=1 Tax=Geodia barretti TaxID=519541 RepID=A0AA35SS68_GEOBA|nr:hypothetical protein GBAR_LOCUS19488 [Geodia barretti]